MRSTGGGEKSRRDPTRDVSIGEIVGLSKRGEEGDTNVFCQKRKEKKQNRKREPCAVRGSREKIKKWEKKFVGFWGGER